MSIVHLHDCARCVPPVDRAGSDPLLPLPPPHLPRASTEFDAFTNKYQIKVQRT